MLEQLKSTFRDDFTIADHFGEKGIKDTYKRAFKHWKDDLEYLTELVLVLNRKCRYWYDHWRNDFSRLYQDLWEEAHDWCCSNLKWEELRYYLRKVD